MGNLHNDIEPTKYTIRVKNHLDTLWEQWFEGLKIEHADNGQTILSGYVADQSALYGILEKIRSLNLTLISIQKMDPDQEKG